MQRINVTDFRRNMRDALIPVLHHDERIVLTHGKLECAIVPKKDLMILQEHDKQQQKGNSMQGSMDQLNRVLKDFLIKNEEKSSHEGDVKYTCTSIVLESLIVYLQGGFSAIKVQGFNPDEFFLLGLFEVMERIMREGKTEIVSDLKRLIDHVQNGFPPLDDEPKKIDTN